MAGESRYATMYTTLDTEHDFDSASPGTAFEVTTTEGFDISYNPHAAPVTDSDGNVLAPSTGLISDSGVGVIRFTPTGGWTIDTNKAEAFLALDGHTALMSYEYEQLSVASDFTSGGCDAVRMKLEIGRDGVVPDARGLGIRGDAVIVLFDDALSVPEQTQLDSLADVHDYILKVLLLSPCIVPASFSITSETWETIGGICLATVTFLNDHRSLFLRAEGECKVAGTGAGLRIVKSPSDTVISPVKSLSDTSGAWVAAPQPHTTSTLDSGGQTYKLQGRLNGATSAEVQCVNLVLYGKPNDP